MPRSDRGAAPRETAATIAAVEMFLAAARDPVLIEPGEPPFALRAGAFAIDGRAGRIQVWDQTRNLARTLRRISRSRSGSLELEVERFGKRTGTILLLDRARSAENAVDRRAARLALREQLRRALGRQFPEWRVAELTTEAFLEQSLSPVYPRALIVRGTRGLAALAAPEDPTAAAHSLSFGLLWLDYLRRRERALLVDGLCLLLPAGGELDTCLRIRWLHPDASKFAVFVYDSPDGEALVDPARHGNLVTELVAPSTGTSPAKALSQREAWLESAIRARPRDLDAHLRPDPIYGQVATWAAAERGLLDLLAIEETGRLVIVELKAAPDIHLPLQALDYWFRVRWHHQQGDLERRGYFPGRPIAPDPPRLTLAAPAFGFHPSTEAILRYFSPQIEVERAGLHVEWFQAYCVMYRLTGSQPAC